MQVLNWFQEAAAAIGHAGLRAAVKAAWTPIAATAEEKAGWGEFDALDLDPEVHEGRGPGAAIRQLILDDCHQL